MNFYTMALQANYVLTIGVTAWAVAQILKTLLAWIMGKRFKAERLVGSGGMPSSHSALVCSVLIAVWRFEGPHSTMFALALILAAIVMYDAMGVRRETGNQAKVLNKLLVDWLDESDPEGNNKQLKELVGHTPFEVIGGAVLGVALALLIGPVGV